MHHGGVCGGDDVFVRAESARCRGRVVEPAAGLPDFLLKKQFLASWSKTDDLAKVKKRSGGPAASWSSSAPDEAASMVARRARPHAASALVLA